MSEAVAMDTQFRESMTDVVMPPYVHCGSPAELLAAYDLLKKEQKIFKSGDLRDWLGWHWVRGLMVVSRRNSHLAGVGLIWRLSDGKAPEDVRFYDHEGSIAFVHYCCVTKRYRDSKGKVMGDLTAALIKSNPWAKELAWESHLDRRRKDDKLRIRRVAINAVL